MKIEKPNIYKRNFWSLHKWTIVFISIPIFFCLLFTSVLVFYAKIFDRYEKTNIIKQYEQNSTYNFVYVVNDIEYVATQGDRLPNNESQITHGDKVVWYSVENPQEYIFGRTTVITICLIVDGIMIVGIVSYIVKIRIKAIKRGKLL